MNASRACDVVVRTLKASCLNFFLQESPFGITINIRKTFIKNQDGKEIYPEQDNFWCMENHVVDEKQVVGDTTEENDNEYSDMNDTINNLIIKLEKAEKEMAHAISDKNKLKDDLREREILKNRETEKHVNEIEQYKEDIKKRDVELAKVYKQSKKLNEDLVLAEAQLENLKTSEQNVIYNVETNNNFEVLCKPKSKCESLEFKTIEVEEQVKKVDKSDYKEYLKNLLENFKENPTDDEPKYASAAVKMIQMGHNIFHVSLLDVGKYNPNLKAFLSCQSRENLHKLEKDCKDIIMAFGESQGMGSFKSDTSVFINPKNYGQKGN